MSSSSHLPIGTHPREDAIGAFCLLPTGRRFVLFPKAFRCFPFKKKRPLGVFLCLARVSVLLRKPSRPLAEVVIRFFPPSPVSVVLVASLGATWRSPADFVGFRRLLSSVDPFGSDFRL